MNFPLFIARRIIFKGQRTFSKLIVRVTIGALALAIIAILLSVAILRGFKDEITAKQRGFFSDIIITKQDLSQAENVPISLSTTKLEEIRNLPNVVSISPFATKVGIMNVNGEVEGVLLKGVESTYDQSFLAKTLVKGDTLNLRAEDGDSQLLISAYLAERLKIQLNDGFIMSFVQDNRTRKRKFVVRGIFRTNSEELDKNYVIGSLDLIRRLNNLGERDAGAYEIRIKDFEQLEATTEQVDDVLPLEMKSMNIVEHLADIFNWLKMLDMNDDIIFVLMVIVAVINMISSLLITILERTFLIGMLKALGMINREIRKIFLLNSLYLIGYGLLIGNVVALFIYILQNKTKFFKLDPMIYYIEYVPMSIDFVTVVVLNVSIVFIALLTLFIPSMLISRISPIKTIQFK
ncbi:ABC transporter permease [Sphingobacterium yanglingense]|uniref:Lipoprotein-releasing system permease protein n=1 Tax=Sphingobacterium yanglingense TaxID=1437280 RepID=A0A4R6WI83_9SPHI|nr:FtsX-like permease family protein [Sphingobacterium yanglingense]TDQ79874.1 lipoprotein-releasing system permease protein [Sphingobacterium yanglingense]